MDINVAVTRSEFIRTALADVRKPKRVAEGTRQNVR